MDASDLLNGAFVLKCRECICVYMLYRDIDVWMCSLDLTFNFELRVMYVVCCVSCVVCCLLPHTFRTFLRLASLDFLWMQWLPALTRHLHSNGQRE